MNKIAIIALITMTLSACSADRGVSYDDARIQEPNSIQASERTEKNKILDSFSDDQPIGVLNFFQFNEVAQYVAIDPEFGTEAAQVSGKAAFEKYLAANYKIAEDLGIKIVFIQDYRQVFVGQDDTEWDITMLLYYPNKTALKNLMASEEFRFGARHRRAAMSDFRMYHIDGRGLDSLASNPVTFKAQ